MITLQAVCIHCHTVTMTEVDPEKMNRYLDGEGNVQQIFPEQSLTGREIIMAQRTGYYVCECIWRNVMDKKEGVVQ
jgi:hypothetical protein